MVFSLGTGSGPGSPPCREGSAGAGAMAATTLRGAGAAGSSSSLRANGRIHPSWNSCSGRCCTRAPSLLATRGSARNRSPRPLSVLRKEERLRRAWAALEAVTGGGPWDTALPARHPGATAASPRGAEVSEPPPNQPPHTGAPCVCLAWPRHREGPLTRVSWGTLGQQSQKTCPGTL